MLLTVSPVPLAATATPRHVLVANTYSKSVLCAVAGDLVAEHERITYFPSYEIIAAHPSRGMFYEPDLRQVNAHGVDFVMSRFFAGPLAAIFPEADRSTATISEIQLVCDENNLDQGVS